MAVQATSLNLLLNKGTIAAFSRDTGSHHSIVNRVHDRITRDHELDLWAPICGPLKHEGLG